MDKKEKLLQKRVAGLFALLCVIFFQFFDSSFVPEGRDGKCCEFAGSVGRLLGETCMAGLFNGESTYIFVCSCRWRGCFDYGRVDAGMVGFFIYSAEIQCREYGSFVCSVSGCYGVGNLL